VLCKSLDETVQNSTQLVLDGAGTSQDRCAEQQARMTVSTIRQTLNEYRDQSRAGLVRSRIQLACTTMTTGLIGYAMLWLALVADVSSAALQAAIAFFLTGALVGLISRLGTEFESDTAIDDFGLSAMRHFAAPQLSGVAAVLGVALLALTGFIGGHPNQPLIAAFDLGTTPMNVVAAAAFGLTPSLLIQRLKQQADTFKGNLKSTEPQATLAASAQHSA
jgi:hypothetical protein